MKDLFGILVICNCECDKSCDRREYLDYKYCKCRRKIVGELVEECSKTIDENAMIDNGTLNAITLNYEKVCSSCALYIVLFAVFLVSSMVISTVFIYFYWNSKKNITNPYY